MIQPGQPSPYNFRGPAAPVGKQADDAAATATGTSAAAKPAVGSSVATAAQKAIYAQMETEEKKRKLKEMLRQIEDLIASMPKAMQGAASAEMTAITNMRDAGDLDGACMMASSLLATCDLAAHGNIEKLAAAQLTKTQAADAALKDAQDKHFEQETSDAKRAFGVDRLTLSIQATAATGQV